MPTILVVDDDRHQRLLYEQELQYAGYDVVLASSGPQAVEAVSAQKIDAVILDIAMPGMDGVETLTKLLNVDRQLPVVLNTAYAGFQDDFMTWAAEAYVVKSADLTELLARVAEALGKRGIAPPEPPAAAEG
jgi:CheY-like chemotaxis protein